MDGQLDNGLFQWIVGGLLTFISGVALRWQSKTQDQLQAIQDRAAKRDERIASLETHVDLGNKRLERMEDTLAEIKDLLIQERRSK